MARDWSQLKDFGRMLWGTTPPGQIYGAYKSIKGEPGGIPLFDLLAPVQEERPALATRPSLGAEGKAAMAEQGRAIQSLMNQQLMQTTIPMINREFAGAGRYASGQRLGAIERATGQAQGMAGGLARQGAMDLYLAQLRAMEERQRFQAQLDVADEGSGLGEMAQYLPYLLMMLG